MASRKQPVKPVSTNRSDSTDRSPEPACVVVVPHSVLEDSPPPMTAVVPHRFLFRYTLPVRRVSGLPKQGKRLLNLPKSCTLPDLSELDNAGSFGELRAAWNERGIGFSVAVSGKRTPLSCDPADSTESDGLQIWIDTRNTQSIHRAGRFCHHFCCLPTGADGTFENPVGLQLPIARAREDAQLAEPEQIRLSAERRRDGYLLECWLPAAILTGFDPAANPLLGFYYYLRDAELGEQYLTVSREFPFAYDPSLWSTLELLR